MINGSNYICVQTVHSGRVIQVGGDKTVPTIRNDWNLGIFLYILNQR